MKRKPLSKRARFEVFKRDAFTCQYCGRKPPEVVLHCDHIMAVANGGTSNDWNLVTACVDCNQGKAAVPLAVTVIPPLPDPKIQQEKLDQLAAYKEFLAAKQGTESAWIKETLKDWLAVIKKLDRVPYVANTVKQAASQFVSAGLTPPEIISALQTTLDRTADGFVLYGSGRSFKYFCGCCWHLVRAKNAPIKPSTLRLGKCWFTLEADENFKLRFSSGGPGQDEAMQTEEWKNWSSNFAKSVNNLKSKSMLATP